MVPEIASQGFQHQQAADNKSQSTGSAKSRRDVQFGDENGQIWRDAASTATFAVFDIHTGTLILSLL
jgi:hypothetical protein